MRVRPSSASTSTGPNDATAGAECTGNLPPAWRAAPGPGAQQRWCERGRCSLDVRRRYDRSRLPRRPRSGAAGRAASSCTSGPSAAVIARFRATARAHRGGALERGPSGSRSCSPRARAISRQRLESSGSVGSSMRITLARTTTSPLFQRATASASTLSGTSRRARVIASVQQASGSRASQSTKRASGVPGGPRSRPARSRRQARSGAGHGQLLGTSFRCALPRKWSPSNVRTVLDSGRRGSVPASPRCASMRISQWAPGSTRKLVRLGERAVIRPPVGVFKNHS